TGPIRGTLPDISRQLDLMREVVVDDPLVPVELKPIDIEAQPGKQAGGVSRAWRSGVEGHPAGTRKVRFHPTVRVAGAALEEEMSEGIVAGFALQVQRVSEIVAQVTFHNHGLVEWIARGRSDAPGKFRNALIECARKLEVSVQNLLGIDGAGGAGPHGPR